MLTYLKEKNTSYALFPMEDTWFDVAGLAVHHRVMPLSPVARLLLSSGGSMTQMLEALTLTTVSMIIKGQKILTGKTLPSPLLGVSGATSALAREAWLSSEGRPLIYAHSLLFSADDSELSLKSIRETDKPLGRLLVEGEVKTLRDGLRIGRVKSPAIAKALSIPPDAELWGRYYRLSTDRGLGGIIFELFSPHLLDG